MATVSFNKDMFFKEPEAIKRFNQVVTNQNSMEFIDKEKASDKVMVRSEELLKQYLSR